MIGRLVADQLSASDRPAGGLREPAGRRQRHRHAGGGALGARRLHVLLRQRGGAGDRSLHLQVAALRSGEGRSTSISNIAEVSFMVLAHPDVPAKNAAGARRLRQGQSRTSSQIATDGPRRFSGMIAAWINKLAGTNISYVPYVQMTQGMQDVISGPRSAHHPRGSGRARAHRRRQAPRAGRDVGEAAAGLSERADGGRNLPGLRFRRLVGAGGTGRRSRPRSCSG